MSQTSTKAGPSEVLWASNAHAVELEAVPRVPASEFADRCAAQCASGSRLSALVALPGSVAARPGARELLAVLADDQRGRLALARTEVRVGESYPALSARLPQAQAFEREIFETTGVVPEGHPWLKPLRRHADLEPEAGPLSAGPPHPFFQVDGHGIHEVAVGPVHAGIIEPGHFRFQCHGETVIHLEIQLGYQHRGAAELFLRSSPARRLAIAESIAGDTALGHGLAHCVAVEALAGVEVSLGAQAARGIALELERLTNHAGDLGALCNDVGYLPGASWLGRLRGDLLNLLLAWSGNRFGRGLVRPGGIRFGLAPAERKELRRELDRIERDLRETVELTLGTSSVVARYERAGTVSRAAAEELGLVGPVARASGCDRDVRRDHPHGIYRFAHIPVATAERGDVMSRVLVRWLEIQRSMAFVREQLAEMPEDDASRELPRPRPGQVVIALVEGWRGEIAHVAVTSADGAMRGYSFVDPSFHNWFGLTVAMRENPISDFPLCNKSFNLSYAGHDL